jgi:hypothetical protein
MEAEGEHARVLLVTEAASREGKRLVGRRSIEALEAFGKMLG